jgi:hypothetical protein
MLPAAARGESSPTKESKLTRHAAWLIEAGVGVVDADLHALRFEPAHVFYDFILLQSVMCVTAVLVLRQEVVTGADPAPLFLFDQRGNAVQRIRNEA